MGEVTPRLKPFVACACGCGEGRPKVKPFKDGIHIRGCPCRRCAGRNFKRTASARERRGARKIGGTRAPLSGQLSGYDLIVQLSNGDVLVAEETAAEWFCRGPIRWWNGKGVAAKLARLLAQRSYLRAAVMPELVVMPRADWDALVQVAAFREDQP